ncbi:MAG: hypothetical protein ACERKD_02860 [Prolixibacteraceae bacterium]
MKFILMIFLLVTLYAPAQPEGNVDIKVSNYPRFYHSTKKLAERINADFNSDEDKAKAIYSWMGNHIQYDIEAFLERNLVMLFD